MTAWLVPTARATTWLPLSVVAGGMALLTALSAYVGQWPANLVGIVAGALAGAVVAGLNDPAETLLAAVPTSATVRRARRLVLLLSAGLLLWLAYLRPAQDLQPGFGWPVGPAVALVATGIAVAVWAPAPYAVPSGVGVPLAWVAAEKVADGFGGPVDEVVLAWQQHPWLVTAAAIAALLIGRNR